MKKPRVRFCWECGKKLYGNSYVEEEIDGHKRILHKQCHAYRHSPFYDKDEWENEVTNDVANWK